MKWPSLFRRMLASTLAFVLFFTQVLFANASEKSIWDERRKAIQLASANIFQPPAFERGTHLPSLPTPSIVSKSRKAPSDLSPLVSLLSVNGVVRDIKPAFAKASAGEPAKASRGARAPVIVYIQDVHGQLEAQKNIASMILKILDLDPKVIVGLEGSAGRIPMESFRGDSAEIDKEVGSFFLNTGLITGAEYAGFAAKAAPSMFGVEDPKLYLENIAAVREALGQQKERLARIEKEQLQLQRKKQNVYSPTLLVLDQKWRDYHDGELSIGDYLSALTPAVHPSSSYPNISLFLKTWTLEKTLNFDKAERERNEFLSRLVEKLDKSEMARLVEQSAALRSGAVTYPDYYQLLKETGAKAGLSLSRTPEFDRYVSYVLQADSIQPEKFLSEVSEYEKAVWEKLCQTPEQRELYRAAARLELTEKLVRLTLTPQEWREYKAFTSFRGDDDLKPFERFYESAEARNAALAGNFLKTVSSSRRTPGSSPSENKANDLDPGFRRGDGRAVVLVAGGFHSDGLSQILSKGDATLITVSPKLTKIGNAKGNEYLNAFTSERTPLEKLFQAPKISLVETLQTNPIYGGGFGDLISTTRNLFVAAYRKGTSIGKVAAGAMGTLVLAVALPGRSPERPKGVKSPRRTVTTDGGIRVDIYRQASPESLGAERVFRTHWHFPVVMLPFLLFWALAPYLASNVWLFVGGGLALSVVAFVLSVYLEETFVDSSHKKDIESRPDLFTKQERPRILFRALSTGTKAAGTQPLLGPMPFEDRAAIRSYKDYLTVRFRIFLSVTFIFMNLPILAALWYGGLDTFRANALSISLASYGIGVLAGFLAHVANNARKKWRWGPNGELGAGSENVKADNPKDDAGGAEDEIEPIGSEDESRIGPEKLVAASDPSKSRARKPRVRPRDTIVHRAVDRAKALVQEDLLIEAGEFLEELREDLSRVKRKEHMEKLLAKWSQKLADEPGPYSQKLAVAAIPEIREEIDTVLDQRTKRLKEALDQLTRAIKEEQKIDATVVPLLSKFGPSTLLEEAVTLHLISPFKGYEIKNSAVSRSLVGILTKNGNGSSEDDETLKIWGLDLATLPWFQRQRLINDPRVKSFLLKIAKGPYAEWVFFHLFQRDIFRDALDLDPDRYWSVVSVFSRYCSVFPNPMIPLVNTLHLPPGEHEHTLTFGNERKIEEYLDKFISAVGRPATLLEKTLALAKAFPIRTISGPLTEVSQFAHMAALFRFLCPDQSHELYPLLSQAADDFLNRSPATANSLQKLYMRSSRFFRFTELPTPQYVIRNEVEMVLSTFSMYLPRSHVHDYFMQKVHPREVVREQPSLFGRESTAYLHWMKMLVVRGNWWNVRELLEDLFPELRPDGPAGQPSQQNPLTETDLMEKFFWNLGNEDRIRITREVLATINLGASAGSLSYVAGVYNNLVAPLGRKVGLMTNGSALLGMYTYLGKTLIDRAKEYRNRYDSTDVRYELEIAQENKEEAKTALLNFFLLNPSPDLFKQALRFWNSQLSPGAPSRKRKSVFNQGDKVKLIGDAEMNPLSWLIKNIPKGAPTRDARRQLHVFVISLIERRIQREDDPVVQFMSHLLMRLNTNISGLDEIHDAVLSFVDFAALFSGLSKGFQRNINSKLQRALHVLCEEAGGAKLVLTASHFQKLKLIVNETLLESVISAPVSLTTDNVAEIRKSIAENSGAWSEGNLLARLVRYYGFQHSEAGQRAVEQYMLVLARSKVENNKFVELPRYGMTDPSWQTWMGENLIRQFQKDSIESFTVSSAETDVRDRYRNIYDDMLTHLGLSDINPSERQGRVLELYANADIGDKAEEFWSVLIEIEQQMVQGSLIPFAMIEQWEKRLETAQGKRVFPNWPEFLINMNQIKMVRLPQADGPSSYDFVVTEEPLAFLLSGEHPYYTCQRIVEPTGQNSLGRPVNRARSGQFILAQVRKGDISVSRSVLEIAKEKKSGQKVLLVERLYTNGLVPSQAFQKKVIEWALRTGEIRYVVFAGGVRGDQSEFEVFIDLELLPTDGAIYRDTDWTSRVRAIDLNKLADKSGIVLPGVETWRRGLHFEGGPSPHASGLGAQAESSFKEQWFWVIPSVLAALVGAGLFTSFGSLSPPAVIFSAFAVGASTLFFLAYRPVPFLNFTKSRFVDNHRKFWDPTHPEAQVHPLFLSNAKAADHYERLRAAARDEKEQDRLTKILRTIARTTPEERIEDYQAYLGGAYAAFGMTTVVITAALSGLSAWIVPMITNGETLLWVGVLAAVLAAVLSALVGNATGIFVHEVNNKWFRWQGELGAGGGPESVFEIEGPDGLFQWRAQADIKRRIERYSERQMDYVSGVEYVAFQLDVIRTDTYENFDTGGFGLIMWAFEGAFSPRHDLNERQRWILRQFFAHQLNTMEEQGVACAEILGYFLVRLLVYQVEAETAQLQSKPEYEDILRRFVFHLANIDTIADARDYFEKRLLALSNIQPALVPKIQDLHRDWRKFEQSNKTLWELVDIYHKSMPKPAQRRDEALSDKVVREHKADQSLGDHLRAVQGLIAPKPGTDQEKAWRNPVGFLVLQSEKHRVVMFAPYTNPDLSRDVDLPNEWHFLIDWVRRMIEEKPGVNRIMIVESHIFLAPIIPWLKAAGAGQDIDALIEKLDSYMKGSDPETIRGDLEFPAKADETNDVTQCVNFWKKIWELNQQGKKHDKTFEIKFSHSLRNDDQEIISWLGANKEERVVLVGNRLQIELDKSASIRFSQTRDRPTYDSEHLYARQAIAHTATDIANRHPDYPWADWKSIAVPVTQNQDLVAYLTANVRPPGFSLRHVGDTLVITSRDDPPPAANEDVAEPQPEEEDNPEDQLAPAGRIRGDQLSGLKSLVLLSLLTWQILSWLFGAMAEHSSGTVQADVFGGSALTFILTLMIVGIGWTVLGAMQPGAGSGPAKATEPLSEGLAEISLVQASRPNAQPRSQEKVLKINASLAEMEVLARHLLELRSIRSVSTPSVQEWQSQKYGAGGFPSFPPTPESAALMARDFPQIWKGFLQAKGIERVDLFVVANLLGYGQVFGDTFVMVPHDDKNLRGEMPTYDLASKEKEVSTRLNEDNEILNRLNPVQRRLLERFLAENLEIPDESSFNYIRACFARLILGDSTPVQLAWELEWTGINDNTAMHLLLRLLMTEKSPEVRDERPVSLATRLRYFERQRNHLSEPGLDVLGRLQTEAQANRLELVQDLFPSARNPHLEYFKPLAVRDAEVRLTLADLSNLRVTQGCSQGCSHCYFSPSRNVTVMPYYRILQLFECCKKTGFPRISKDRFTLYYDTEMFDYYDPLFDADIGDVLTSILDQFPQQEIHVTTRGWYLGDRIGPRAAEKIQDLWRRKRSNIDVRVSLDLFNTKGDEVRYIVRMVHVLSTFAGGSILIGASAGNDNRDETSAVVELIRSLASHLHGISSTYEHGGIGVTSQMGRAKKIETGQRHDVGYCMFGCNITPDGKVEQKVRNVHAAPLIRDSSVPDADVVAHKFNPTGVALWDPTEPLKAILPSPTGTKRSGFVLSGSGRSAKLKAVSLPIAEDVPPTPQPGGGHFGGLKSLVLLSLLTSQILSWFFGAAAEHSSEAVQAGIVGEGALITIALVIIGAIWMTFRVSRPGEGQEVPANENQSVTVQGPETSIEWQMTRGAKEIIDLLSSSTPEIEAGIVMLQSRLEEVKKKEDDPFGMFDGKEHVGLFFWVIERFFGITPHLDLQEKSLLTHEIVGFLSAFNSVLMSGDLLEWLLGKHTDKLDGKARFEVWQYFLIRLLVIKHAATQLPGGSSKEEYWLLIDDVLGIVVNSLFDDFKGSYISDPKATIEPFLFQVAKSNPSLKSSIGELLEDWDDLAEEGIQLAIRQYLEEDEADSDLAEEAAAQNTLARQFLELRSVLNPRQGNPNKAQAWDHPIEHLVARSQQAQVVYFHPTGGLGHYEVHGHELSNAWQFQLDWLDRMAQAGFKRLAFTKVADYLEELHHWSHREKDSRSGGELIDLLQEYLDSAGTIPLRTFLNLPTNGTEPVEVTRTIKFWESVWEFKHQHSTEVILFFNFEEDEKKLLSDKQKRFEQWLTAGQPEIVVLGDLETSRISPDTPSLKIHQRKTSEDYVHDELIPASAIPHVVHGLGRDYGMGDWKSVAISLRQKEELADYFRKLGGTQNLLFEVWLSHKFDDLVVTDNSPLEDDDQELNPIGSEDDSVKPGAPDLVPVGTDSPSHPGLPGDKIGGLKSFVLLSLLTWQVLSWLFGAAAEHSSGAVQAGFLGGNTLAFIILLAVISFGWAVLYATEPGPAEDEPTQRVPVEIAYGDAIRVTWELPRTLHVLEQASLSSINKPASDIYEEIVGPLSKVQGFGDGECSTSDYHRVVALAAQYDFWAIKQLTSSDLTREQRKVLYKLLPFLRNLDMGSIPGEIELYFYFLVHLIVLESTHPDERNEIREVEQELLEGVIRLEKKVGSVKHDYSGRLIQIAIGNEKLRTGISDFLGTWPSNPYESDKKWPELMRLFGLTMSKAAANVEPSPRPRNGTYEKVKNMLAPGAPGSEKHDAWFHALDYALQLSQQHNLVFYDSNPMFSAPRINPNRPTFEQTDQDSVDFALAFLREMAAAGYHTILISNATTLLAGISRFKKGASSPMEDLKTLQEFFEEDSPTPLATHLLVPVEGRPEEVTATLKFFEDLRQIQLDLRSQGEIRIGFSTVDIPPAVISGLLNSKTKTIVWGPQARHSLPTEKKDEAILLSNNVARQGGEWNSSYPYPTDILRLICDLAHEFRPIGQTTVAVPLGRNTPFSEFLKSDPDQYEDLGWQEDESDVWLVTIEFRPDEGDKETAKVSKGPSTLGKVKSVLLLTLITSQIFSWLFGAMAEHSSGAVQAGLFGGSPSVLIAALIVVFIAGALSGRTLVQNPEKKAALDKVLSLIGPVQRDLAANLIPTARGWWAQIMLNITNGLGRVLSFICRILDIPAHQVRLVHVDEILRQTPDAIDDPGAYKKTLADLTDSVNQALKDNRQQVLVARYYPQEDPAEVEEALRKNLILLARGMSDEKMPAEMARYLNEQVVIDMRPMGLIKPSEVLNDAAANPAWNYGTNVWFDIYTATPDQFDLTDAWRQLFSFGMNAVRLSTRMAGDRLASIGA